MGADFHATIKAARSRSKDVACRIGVGQNKESTIAKRRRNIAGVARALICFSATTRRFHDDKSRGGP